MKGKALIKCPVCGNKLEVHQIYFDRSFDYDGSSEYSSLYHFECSSCPLAIKAGKDVDDAWENLQEFQSLFPRTEKKK